MSVLAIANTIGYQTYSVTSTKAMTHARDFLVDGKDWNRNNFSSTTLQNNTQSQQITQIQKKTQPYRHFSSSEEILSQSEEIICSFFVNEVVNDSPELVLEKFKGLFFQQTCQYSEKANQALYEVLGLNEEMVFQSILIRSCYILVNNWSAKRQFSTISELIDSFSSFYRNTPTGSISLIKQRCYQWVINFIESQDYQILTAFIARHDSNKNLTQASSTEEKKPSLSQRYAYYLLASHSQDIQKPQEQREAARRLSQQLKENFKFELAMYTARCQSSPSEKSGIKNPTGLGDNVLQLIQKILGAGSKFSYVNIANIFLKQTEGLYYADFKESLLKYLFYSFGEQDWVKSFKSQIAQKLDSLYSDYNENLWNSNLLLRTCNRLIEYLTTENHCYPSDLFTIIMMKRQSLSLVIILLKLTLISRSSYNQLEVCIASLIKFYDKQVESDHQWLVEFLEALQVTLVIYSENVCYNLVSVSHSQSTGKSSSSQSFRIFSISKSQGQLVEQSA